MLKSMYCLMGLALGVAPAILALPATATSAEAVPSATSTSQSVQNIPYTGNVTDSEFICPNTTSSNLTQSELQDAMNDFALAFYTEKNLTRAFDTYVAENYVQHNAGILDGRDAAVAALSPLFGSPNSSFEIGRVMVGPEYTVIHIKAVTVGAPNFTVFDAYRTIGSCIVEHWDGLQAMVLNATNPHAYF